EVGHLVHEGDAGGKHGVGGVLGHLRVPGPHEDEAVAGAQVGGIELRHAFPGALAVGANDDAIGPHEVLDRRPLLEEFRVAYHIEGDVDAAPGQLVGHRRPYLLGGAHRHRRLVDDHRIVLEVGADGAGGGEHVLEVGGAVLPG